MSDITEIHANYTLTADDWKRPHKARNAIAVQAWLNAARSRGLEVSVVEVSDEHLTVAVVEVAGTQYEIRHQGRSTELSAVRR